MYPWQLDPPLPTTVTIDLTNHHRGTLSAPPVWEILQRNGQTFITPPGQATVSLDQAQFGMLRVLHSREQPDQYELSVSFLTQLRESCLAQRRADGMWRVIHTSNIMRPRLLPTRGLPSGEKWISMHSLCGFSFKRGQDLSSARFTVNCAVTVPVNVQF
jgi:hypothetical protein